MKNEQIIEAIKEHYSRDIRKQLVKGIVRNEKNNDKEAIESSYSIVNQIFSFVISELGWTFSQNSEEWSDEPLKIMLKAFPNIDKTKWFEAQLLQVRNSVELKEG